MPHPLLIGWILKQASVFNLYAAGKAYGFHRVYRRLLEANRRLVAKPEDRRIIQENLKEAMRFPTKVVDVLEESHTVAFLQKYAQELTSSLETKAPPFFVTAAKIILTKTPLGKVFEIFDDWRGAYHRRKRESTSKSSSSGSSGGEAAGKGPPRGLLPEWKEKDRG